VKRQQGEYAINKQASSIRVTYKQVRVVSNA